MPGANDKFISRLVWLTLAAALLMTLWEFLPTISSIWTTTPSAPRPVVPRGDLAADEKTTIEIFEKAKGSVVYITTQEQVMDVWTRNVFSVPKGTGSGFMWDEAGHVITNFHVVQGAVEARVKLADGRDYKAVLTGASPAYDIAVLRISTGTRHPPPLPVGASGNLKTGQKVYAIGNPFGLDWSLTTGIISALDRSLPAENGGSIEHLIQTDAAINPGNSGGPLLDSAGRLIGMNTAIFSPSGASAGIGFAVPVDTLNRVVPELIRSGKYIRPTIGAEVDGELNQRLAEALAVKGVVVLKVTAGSSAEAAGLKGVQITREGVIAGDIITEVEGQPVDTVGKFQSRLDDFKVGSPLRLTVMRDGHKREVTVKLQAGA